MMTADFDAALAFVLLQEGGNDDDPHDPGGRTSRGIIQVEYNLWRRQHGEPVRDVWSATDDEVRQIYFDSYWAKMHGDDLPHGVNLMLFDSAVNSGNGQATKWLQRSLNVVADGVFGVHTFMALSDERDLAGLITEIAARRLNMLEHLSTWRFYKNGWMRRVNECQSLALAWLKG